MFGTCKQMWSEWHQLKRSPHNTNIQNTLFTFLWMTYCNGCYSQASLVLLWTKTCSWLFHIWLLGLTLNCTTTLETQYGGDVLSVVIWRWLTHWAAGLPRSVVRAAVMFFEHEDLWRYALLYYRACLSTIYRVRPGAGKYIIAVSYHTITSATAQMYWILSLAVIIFLYFNPFVAESY